MLLKLENVQKHYGGFSLDCSLDLRPGYITGLIGQNGAGKTTVFKSVLGLISIDGGSIEVFGKAVRSLTPKDREDMGVVLADSGFSAYLTIKDIIPVMQSLYSKFDKEGFIKKCREFDLPLNKRIKDFSTGMKAKLKVIAAMSHDAKLLIFDEPTAGLDVIARDGLLDYMRSYMEQDERSLLISSHISSDLENLCDDLYLIDHGRMVLHEETDVLLSSYGLLKVTEEQYAKLDKRYIIRHKKEAFGHSCLTDQKQFYLENSPGIVVEKGNVDEVMTMMIRGEQL
ncbi:ATP-binding cassette domain-containing protein [Clostridium sp. Marseille-P2415]|uniref:ATP-binding cassette domain-containing protein n=1 Tax=Clostridium sp. Marseille-P2415 TaxID=1805471 RepID=UPI0009883309|nr:ABC transporter ATP-binding protein [Clostridium sp. Marseille-P2415]